MPNSLNTHCILTEDVHETLSGKGREGKGTGKGSNVETSHHIVTYVGASAQPSVEVVNR